MAGRCSLCGSRLNNGKCEFCGLNNKMYDREYFRNPYHMPAADTGSGTQKSAPGYQRKTSRHMRGLPETRTAAETGSQQRTFSAGFPRQTDQARSKGSDSRRKKYRAATLIIIFVVIIGMFAPVLIQIGRSLFDGSTSTKEDSWLSGIDSIFSDDTDDSWSYDDYDPYTYVTREIPESGSTYETTIGSGIYQVGVHIPEGIYRVELAGESGSLQISDTENLIYESVWFGEDEDFQEVTEADDLRLYNGAQITIDGGAVLSFTTSNAQPLTQEVTANPLTESIFPESGTYIVGDSMIPEGIYDIVLEGSDSYESFSMELLYPNGSGEYLWSYYESGVSDGRIRNVILPAGTEVTLEVSYSDSPLEFVPSEGYFELDYTEYPWN